MKFLHFFKHDDSEISAQIKAATNFDMDATTRERMRAHLSEYTKLRPIRSTQPTPEFAPQHSWTFFSMHPMPFIAFALILVATGSTAAAAEGALPGDMLYPIKVHVNEEVRATLAVTPKAKADWAVARAERRLEEAATLAVAGKLDDVTRAEINTNIDGNVKSAGENRVTLENTNDLADASEVATNISAISVARENILDDKRGRSRDAKEIAAVRAAAAISSYATLMPGEAIVTDMSADQAATTSSEAIRKGERTAAKVRIEATRKFLDDSRNKLHGNAREEVQAQLNAATEALSSGDANAERGDKSGASANFNSALKAATGIETILSTSNNSSDENGSKDGTLNEIRN